MNEMRRAVRLPRAARLAIGSVASIAMVTTLAVTGIQERSEGVTGYEAVLGDQQLSIMAPANPGGGWDQTARAMQTALADVVGRTEVYNVGGAGGTIGLPQFARLDGQANQLMATGSIMVGAILTNGSSTTLDDVDVLARLLTEYLVVVVPADSDIQSMDDLAEAMRADVGAVSVAGGSAGGVEQILAGLIAEDVGADPTQVSYVAHSGGGEALTTILSGRATAGVGSINEMVPYVADGTMRALAVSSPERSEQLPDVPSLMEAGVDVELQNWRAVAAPLGLTDEERDALVQLLDDMRATDPWQDTLADRGWEDAWLTGPELDAFLSEDQQTTEAVLAQLGLLA